MKILFKTTYMKLAEKAKAEAKRKFDFTMPSIPMVEACRTREFDFFQPFIDSGMMTESQMHRATERYYLGKTRNGMPIFWMIDEMMQPLDARIGNGWISQMLKKREPLLQYWPVKHCLFGLHLAYQPSLDHAPVAIVESEASAMVLSELIPECIWMAYVTIGNLDPYLLAPLEGRTVTIYPRTDPSMNTYMFFLDYAEIVRHYSNINLRIDSTLEHHATPEQKERCIDLLEFICDNP